MNNRTLCATVIGMLLLMLTDIGGANDSLGMYGIRMPNTNKTVELSYLIGQADLIVIGTVMRQTGPDCDTEGRIVTLPNFQGTYNLVQFAVNEIIAARTGTGDIWNTMAVLEGNGATGVYIMTHLLFSRTLTDNGYFDAHLKNDSPELLWLRNYAVDEGKATALHVGNTNAVYQVVSGCMGAITLDASAQRLPVAGAKSKTEILECMRAALSYVAEKGNDKQAKPSVQSSNVLLTATVAKLKESGKARQFRVTNMRIEQRYVDRHGRPLEKLTDMIDESNIMQKPAMGRLHKLATDMWGSIPVPDIANASNVWEEKIDIDRDDKEDSIVTVQQPSVTGVVRAITYVFRGRTEGVFSNYTGATPWFTLVNRECSAEWKIERTFSIREKLHQRMIEFTRTDSALGAQGRIKVNRITLPLSEVSTKPYEF